MSRYPVLKVAGPGDHHQDFLLMERAYSVGRDDGMKRARHLAVREDLTVRADQIIREEQTVREDLAVRSDLSNLIKVEEKSS